jgi:hypothetical protein
MARFCLAEVAVLLTHLYDQGGKAFRCSSGPGRTPVGGRCCCAEFAGIIGGGWAILDRTELLEEVAAPIS